MKKRVLLGLLALVLVVSLVAFAACAEEEEVEEVEFTLKITAVGEGTTSPKPGTSTITEGESVTVTAKPDKGYEFDRWEGDVSGTNTSITVKMTSAKSVVAVFVEEVIVEEWEWPEKLLITAISTRTSSYASAVAWSTPLAKDTGMTIRIICEADVRLQTLWVKEGRFFTRAPHQDRSMLYATPGHARRDWGPWVSAIWMPMGTMWWGYYVLGDSGIKTPYDLKPGMKAGIITLGEEPQQMIYGVLAWGQVDPEDITMVPIGSIGGMTRLLMDGRADFMVGYCASSQGYEVEASPHGLGWIEMDWENDPEGAARFLSYYPWTGFGIATGVTPSAEGVRVAEGISPYITRFDTDPELVYRLVKWLDENYDIIKDTHPTVATMTLENLLDMAEHMYEPIHDGAVRYLEEKGMWTEELEARRQYNIELLQLWVDSYQTAMNMADDRGIDVNPDNEEWQELWYNYKRDNELPLLVYFQGPGKEQPGYYSFYDRWERERPKW